jgi:hypothetical protein
MGIKIGDTIPVFKKSTEVMIMNRSWDPGTIIRSSSTTRAFETTGRVMGL